MGRVEIHLHLKVWGDSMGPNRVMFLFWLGVTVLITGLLLIVSNKISIREMTMLLAGAGLALLGSWVQRAGKSWFRQELQGKHAAAQASPGAAPWVFRLFGNYPPYVVEAAQELGAARDITAVPAIMFVLENCVAQQPAGWREEAEALANALGQIGDGRALPMLRRLENVRGIGFIPAIRSAIAAIEPNSSLLRASSRESGEKSTLLMPCESLDAEKQRQILLRVAEAE